MSDYAVIRVVSDRESDHGLVRTFGYLPGEVFYLAEVERGADNLPVVSSWEQDPAKAVKLPADDAARLVRFYQSIDDTISTFIEHATEPPLPCADA